MDVLNPSLVWVDGRCYRFYESNMFDQEKQLVAYEEEEIEVNYYSNEEDIDEDVAISQLPSGQYVHLMDISKEFYRFIIGAKGATKKRIESETKTTITLPNRGQSGEINILGADRKAVASAKNRIDLIVESSRNKLSVTHFVSVPMNHEDIIKTFNEFKQEILTNRAQNMRNISEELFQSERKLHLTVTAMILLDNKERDAARECLRKCKEHVIDPFIDENGPIKVQVKGVQIMNDDPAQCNVLYGTVVDESGGLQKLLNSINNYFVEAGISHDSKNRDNVKMHMTLMNMSFLHRRAKMKLSWRETFDATEILERHKDTCFGEITIPTLHLSQIGAKDEDGYYKATEIIHLFEQEC